VRRAFFWISAGLIVYTHAGYPAALWALTRLRGPKRAPATRAADALPSVSLIVAAYDEAEAIAAKVADALALEYPRECLEIIVASDGSADATVAQSREAGADLVLDLPRAGKLMAQNAAAERAAGDVLAFSDANSRWETGALAALVAPFTEETVGYVCGQVRFTDEAGENVEGAYWRYEMAVREMESGLGGVTAGNGAIYAVRAGAYLPLGPAASHDLSFPFELARRGLRSVYAPDARAREKMVPSLEGELTRKRRMMVGLWDIVVGERMLSLRGYPPLFAFQLVSHRAVRYATPFLHLALLGANLSLLRWGRIYRASLVAQAGLLLAAAAAKVVPAAPLRVARYYISVTASIALGLWDRLRGGRPGAWEKAEGTR